MATFDPRVDPTNDPYRLSEYSRGTDRLPLQPLADVPKLETKYVQPDYKADLSTGKLLEGLGTVGSEGIKLADAVVKTNINDDVTKSINNIRDSYGVAAAVANSDFARSVGSAGAENTPTPTGTTLLPKDPNQPMQLQKLGTRIDGLMEMYSQGELSNSSYYAKMETAVRQIKAQHPGFSDDVDEIVKSKLGVNPANALRTALQEDVQKLAAKVQSQADKWTTFERQNAGTISQLYGSYENYQAGRAKGAISQPEVEAKIANFNAKQETDKAELQGISLANAQDARRGQIVERSVTSGMTGIVDASMNTTLNQTSYAGDQGPERSPPIQLITEAILSGKRPLPNPEEKTALTAQIQLYRQNANNALDRYLDDQIFDNAGHMVTRRSLINDPQKIEAMKKAAMSPIDTYAKVILGNEDASLLQFDALNIKARQDATTKSMVTQSPAILAGQVYKDRVGDALTAHLYLTQPAFRDSLLQGLRQQNWNQTAQGGGSLVQTLKDYAAEGHNDPNLSRATVDDTKIFIQHPEKLKDKSVQLNAIERLFGPGNVDMTNAVLAGSGRTAATQFFSSVTDPKTLEAIDKTDQAHKNMLVSWAENSWWKIYGTEANFANQVTVGYSQNNNLTLNYDPSANRFYYTSGFHLLGGDKGIVQNANSKLEGLNVAVQSMKRVWDMQGKSDITEKLVQWMPQAGIEQGTPIYTALEKQRKKDEANNTP